MNYLKHLIKTLLVAVIIDVLIYIPVFFIEPTVINKAIQNWVLILFPLVLLYFSIRKYKLEKLTILRRIAMAWALVVVIFIVQITLVYFNPAKLELNPTLDPSYMFDITIVYAIILLLATNLVAVFIKNHLVSVK